MFFKKMKEKKGGSTILEVLLCTGFITFVLFFPISTFATVHKQNLINDVLATGLQIVSVEGGLTDRAEELIYKNLETKGLLPKDSTEEQRAGIVINSDNDARNGKLGNIVNRYDPDPEIFLEIKIPAKSEVDMLNALSKFINSDTGYFKDDDASSEWDYTFRGYALSERVEY